MVGGAGDLQMVIYKWWFADDVAYFLLISNNHKVDVLLETDLCTF